MAYFKENLALLILQADHSRRWQNIIRLFPLPVSRGKRLVLPLVWLCFCPDIDILNCFCDFEKMKRRSNLDQRNSKMAPYIFIIANTYASSMCRWVSYPFQIYSSYTCGQAKTVRKRYKWKRIFLKTEKKSCVFKRIRIRVDKAWEILVVTKWSVGRFMLADVRNRLLQMWNVKLAWSPRYIQSVFNPLKPKIKIWILICCPY